MEVPFIYNKFVTGKNFIGRKEDCAKLINIIKESGHISIYEASKSGVTSLIQQTLLELHFLKPIYIKISLSNVRSLDGFISKFYNGLKTAFGNIDLPIVNTLQDTEALLLTPFKLAKDKKVIIHLQEFQNIDFWDEAYYFFKIIDKTLTKAKEEMYNNCTYIFTGSMVNAMKDIFKHRLIFHKQVTHIALSVVGKNEIADYIHKGFLQSGKVIEKQQVINICKVFKNKLYYLNLFACLCDSMSKGYITDYVINQALTHLLSLYEPCFKAQFFNLTNHQISLLKAILEGHAKLSATQIVEKYNLNSSANVKRVKDALTKKEIISFNNNDEPYFLDPLLEHWAREVYFNLK